VSPAQGWAQAVGAWLAASVAFGVLCKQVPGWWFMRKEQTSVDSFGAV